MKNGEELIDSTEGMAIGRKNLIAGFWVMASFMFLGFALVYLRDFAPGAAEWAAQYGTGKHFETRLAMYMGRCLAF